MSHGKMTPAETDMLNQAQRVITGVDFRGWGNVKRGLYCVYLIRVAGSR